jgi:hypothetical protein
MYLEFSSPDDGIVSDLLHMRINLSFHMSKSEIPEVTQLGWLGMQDWNWIWIWIR